MSETNKMDKLILNGQNIDLSPDYQNIRNKPKINGVTVDGNKTLDDFGVATKQEVENVSKKVAKLPYGIFYGQYDDVESLPDVSQLTQKGYAYVATIESNIFYIYAYDGEGDTWQDSGNKFDSGSLESNLSTKSQTKAPTTKAVKEGIDAVNLLEAKTSTTELTKVQKYQALANINDRIADTIPVTGEVKALGHKVLNPNLSFASQVVAENTVYEIKDNFDLGGIEQTSVSVSIPRGCTLKFNGGTISNGTIVGNSSTIEASYKIFNNVSVLGDWKCVGKVCWWANGNGFVESVVNGTVYYKPTKVDETIELQTALDSSFKELVFEPVCYYITDTLELHNDKNLVLVGTSNHYLFNQTNLDMQNKTFIFTDQNINMLIVDLSPMQTTRHFSINGGIFDASMKASGYDKTVIKVNTGIGQRIWSCEINTTIYGTYSGHNKPGGYGIVMGDIGTRTDGYATMIRINSNINWVGTAVKIVGEDTNSTTTGWISDVVVDGVITSCRHAVDVSTNSDIRASIQPSAFFTLKDKNQEACIIVRGDSPVGISSMVWDLNVQSGNSGYYTNAKALEILDRRTRYINLYGQFASNFLRVGQSYIKGTAVNVDPNALTRNNIWFPYDKVLHVGGSLHDIMLGYDLTDVGDFNAKLYRVTTIEQDNNIVETTTEDTTTLTVSGLTNIFRDNGSTCVLQTSTALGEKDYFELNIGLPFSTSAGGIVLSNLCLMFPKTTDTINTIKKVRLFLSTTEQSGFEAPISQPNNMSYTGVMNADYAYYESNKSNMYANTSISIRLYGEGATNFQLYRIIANQFLNAYSNLSLVSPFLSRVGGTIIGRTKFSNLFANDTKIKGVSPHTYNLLTPLKAGSAIKINLDVTTNIVARGFLLVYSSYNYVNPTIGVLPIPSVIGYFIGGSPQTKTSGKYDAKGLKHILSSIYGDSNLSTLKIYKANDSAESLTLILQPTDLTGNYSVLSVTGNYDGIEVINITNAQIEADYTEITDKIVKLHTASTEITPFDNKILWTGCSYFNTTLGKPIWWNGSSWVDSNGETIGLQGNDTTILLEAAADSSKTINVYSSSAITATVQNPDGSTTDLWLTASVGTLTDGAYPVTLTATNANSANPRGAKVIISNGTDVVIVNVVQNYSTT